MRFPSIKTVRKALVRLNREYDNEMDVRLQVYEDGQWAVRFGLSDYDQDHRGYWGCSTLPCGRKRFNARETAKDLIDQCREGYANSRD